MMYPYLTLNDQTEITHSEMKDDGSVKVYIETPDENGGFHSAVCWLPQYKWENIRGYTDEEMAFFQELVRNNAHLMIEFSQDGGVLYAAGVQIGPYTIYFWSNENDPLEPVHIHIAEGKAVPNATKVWITSAGRTLICNNNSNIPDRILNRLLRVVEANAQKIVNDWLTHFGEIRYYC